MGDHKDAGPPAGQQIQRVGDTAHVAPVKVAGGLVEDEHVRALGSGAGDHKPLLFAAGKRLRVTFRKPFQRV